MGLCPDAVRSGLPDRDASIEYSIRWAFRQRSRSRQLGLSCDDLKRRQEVNKNELDFMIARVGFEAVERDTV